MTRIPDCSYFSAVRRAHSISNKREEAVDLELDHQIERKWKMSSASRTADFVKSIIGNASKISPVHWICQLTLGIFIMFVKLKTVHCGEVPSIVDLSVSG